MLLLFVQKSYADEFDDFMSEYQHLLKEPKMEKETIQPTYKPGCDSLDRAYQIRTEWMGDHWVARQEYCNVDAPCPWLKGKDPSLYCKSR